MTYGKYENFMNALEKLKCREKHPVSRANYGNTENVLTARSST